MRRFPSTGRSAGTAALLLWALLLAIPAQAQLRYMGTLDLREKFDSNVFAGVTQEDPNPDPTDPNPPQVAVAPQRDLITEIQPSLRLYLGLPSDLLSLRYSLLFQLFALTSLTDEQGNSRGNVMGYGNTLSLGYSHRFGNRLELGLANRFEQGTETVNVSGSVSPGGVPGIGALTTGAKTISNTLEAGLHYQLARRWALAPRVEGSFFTGYDHSDSSYIIPPPMSTAVSVGVELQRYFSVGQLGLSTGYTHIFEYRDQSIEQNQLFPSTFQTTSAGLSLTWRQQLSAKWDYSVDAGLDMRILEQYEQPAGADVVNLGYGNPEFNPAGGASVRFRWEHFLQASLGYGHRLQRQLERAISTVTNVDQVGLDVYLIQGQWRFDVFGAFRYLHNSTRNVDDAESTNDTMEILAQGAVVYVLHPSVSFELTYRLESVLDRQMLALGTNGQLGQHSTSYALHQATIGISLAWPAPPARANQLNRRASEREPLFHFAPQAGAADTLHQEGGVDSEQRQGSAPRCGAADADPASCLDGDDDDGDTRDNQRGDEFAP